MPPGLVVLASPEVIYVAQTTRRDATEFGVVPSFSASAPRPGVDCRGDTDRLDVGQATAPALASLNPPSQPHPECFADPQTATQPASRGTLPGGARRGGTLVARRLRDVAPYMPSVGLHGILLDGAMPELMPSGAELVEWKPL